MKETPEREGATWLFYPVCIASATSAEHEAPRYENNCLYRDKKELRPNVDFGFQNPIEILYVDLIQAITVEIPLWTRYGLFELAYLYRPGASYPSRHCNARQQLYLLLVGGNSVVSPYVRSPCSDPPASIRGWRYREIRLQAHWRALGQAIAPCFRHVRF